MSIDLAIHLGRRHIMLGFEQSPLRLTAFRDERGTSMSFCAGRLDAWAPEKATPAALGPTLNPGVAAYHTSGLDAEKRAKCKHSVMLE